MLTNVIFCNDGTLLIITFRTFKDAKSLPVSNAATPSVRPSIFTFYFQLHLKTD